MAVVCTLNEVKQKCMLGLVNATRIILMFFIHVLGYAGIFPKNKRAMCTHPPGKSSGTRINLGYCMIQQDNVWDSARIQTNMLT